MLGIMVSRAQVSAYTFSQSIQPYGAFSTGTLIGTQSQDNDLNVATLPFNFVFNGVSHSTVNVSSNGYLSFANTSAMIFDPISNATSQQIISACGSDLLMGAYMAANLTAGSNVLTNVTATGLLSVGDVLFDYASDFAPGTVSITAISGNSVTLSLNAINTQPTYLVIFQTSSIRQTNSGVSPNRVCEFEYKKFGRSNSVNSEGISFKIRLYETTNKIEIVYNMNNVEITNQPVEVGLKGSANSDFNIRKVAAPASWNASTTGILVTDNCDLFPYNTPTIGLCFQWTPGCSVLLNIVQSNSTICSGSSSTITASGASSYTWSNLSTSSQIVVTPTINTTYTVSASSGSCSTSFIVTQSVVPIPSLSVSATSTQICTGNSASLAASGANSYTWSNGINLATTVVSPSVGTNYTVSTSNGFCSTIKTISISVLPSPTLNVSATATLICRGNSTTLSATSAANYTWSNGSNLPSTIVSPTISNTYTVSTSNGICSSSRTIAINVSNCTNIASNLDSENDFRSYPNPFNNELTFKNTANTEMTVRLTNALGKLVAEFKLTENEELIFNTSQFAEGMYILESVSKDIKHIKKIIKQ